MKYLIYIISIIFFTSCSEVKVYTDAKILHDNLKESQIKSILILPTTNSSMNSSVDEVYRYTISEVVAQKGYYLFPIHLVDGFFKSENLTDANSIRYISLDRLKEVFGADAVLYINIDNWDSSVSIKDVIQGVQISYNLVDTKTKRSIWSKIALYSENRVNNVSNIGIFLLSSVVNILSSDNEYAKHAYMTNIVAFEDFPYGPYSEYQDDIKIELKTLIKEIKDNKLYIEDEFVDGNSDEELSMPRVESLRGTSGYYSIYNYSTYAKDDKIRVVHNGYEKYFYEYKIDDKIVIKNNFFFYDIYDYAYLIYNNKKVYIDTNHKKDEDGYYFDVIDYNK
jgi:hypothetical protein